MLPDRRRNPAAVALLEGGAYTVLTTANTTGDAMNTEICWVVFADHAVYNRPHADFVKIYPLHNAI